MNGDIAQLLYGIKVNIAAIEDGDRTPQLFTASPDGTSVKKQETPMR